MAGGPSTPGLVAAAAAAGAVGFLAAGYKAPDVVARDVAQLRESRLPFGLNIFVPSPPPTDVAALEAYRRAPEPGGRRGGGGRAPPGRGGGGPLPAQGHAGAGAAGPVGGV